ncbi:MAG: SH3 domain-containing protein [Anaerolineae bacterium]|nr:SH3 domain-containing protein [Anaerolineae bacterium]
MTRSKIALFIVCLTLLLPRVLFAQTGQLAATLEVLTAGVEVKRVDTASWLPVKVEAIVGVGDAIRTDATGQARITFFADGVDTDLLPGTEYVIKKFEGSSETFTLSVEVLIGQTTQRIGRALDAGSSYDVQTPAMSLTARGTAFAIRVEDSGRAGMLVTEGMVEAGSDEEQAAVAPDFGIRAEVEGELSDVVRAKSFAELDAALDGCTTAITTPDDVSINVRIAPRLDATRVGTISAAEVVNFKGVTEGGSWYRIDFRGGFGWILASNAVVGKECAGLRVFPADVEPEDAALYEFIGDPGDLTTIDPTATPESEPAATPTP